MSQDPTANNKRIAKNTLLLYFRMLFTMAVSLYTGRVVLDVLGVDDYGIYNVVGGVVAMFSVLSGSLTAAISRFITYELGHGDNDKLKKVFCTSVNIQVVMALIILVIAETVGVWFLNYKINIPTERLYAANWVLQCSILTFMINLISVPYNASIIAHEKMSAYAYISILEVVLKLVIVYLLAISPFDKLIIYAIMLTGHALLIRSVYSIYCKHRFEECSYKFLWDKSIFKEMLGFAGWNFFGNTTYVLNTQGVNMLINIYFGVAMNAARGIAVQVDGALMGFVNNFTMAIQPQITKSYAQGDLKSVYTLVIRGFKFSAYITFFFTLPFALEAESILKIWLKKVPDYSAVFLQAVIFATFIGAVGNTLYHAIIATGKIRRYQIQVTILGTLVFFGTWIAYALGAGAVITYIIYAFIYAFIIVLRLFTLKSLMDFPIAVFVREALIPVLIVGILSLIVPLSIILIFKQSLIRFLITCASCVICTALFAYSIGITKSERVFVNDKVQSIINKILQKS